MIEAYPNKPGKSNIVSTYEPAILKIEKTCVHLQLLINARVHPPPEREARRVPRA